MTPEPQGNIAKATLEITLYDQDGESHNGAYWIQKFKGLVETIDSDYFNENVIHFDDHGFQVAKVTSPVEIELILDESLREE